MKPKFLPVMDMCIDSGVRIGLTRAYKHNDNPSEDQIAASISKEIINQFYEWFDFEEFEE